MKRRFVTKMRPQSNIVAVGRRPLLFKAAVFQETEKTVCILNKGILCRRNGYNILRYDYITACKVVLPIIFQTLSQIDLSGF